MSNNCDNNCINMKKHISRWRQCIRTIMNHHQPTIIINMLIIIKNNNIEHLLPPFINQGFINRSLSAASDVLSISNHTTYRSIFYSNNLHCFRK